jgi:hypothetical protein
MEADEEVAWFTASGLGRIGFVKEAIMRVLSRSVFSDFLKAAYESLMDLGRGSAALCNAEESVAGLTSGPGGRC